MDIKQIKNLYAKERGYDSWYEFENKTPSFHISGHMTEIAQRYAQQYIDSNKEFVEMLERIIDAQFNPNKPLSSLNTTIKEAKELINKNKQL